MLPATNVIPFPDRAYVYVPDWTAEDVAILLGAVTAYPLQRDASPRIMEVLSRVESVQHGRHLLTECLAVLPEPGRTALHAFLQGYSRVQVCRMLTEWPMDRSSAYNAIRRLPAHVLPVLRARITAIPPEPVIQPHLQPLLQTLHACRELFLHDDVEQLINLAYIEQIVIEHRR